MELMPWRAFQNLSAEAASEAFCARAGFSVTVEAPMRDPGRCFNLWGAAYGDGINGVRVIARKRFAVGQRWKRSVCGRPWHGKNTTGPSLLPHQIAWTTFCAL